MTNEEIFNKIKQYESKWGKLGHTNIMNPEKNAIHHSGINKDISQGGNKTMSRLDNELYKFRQKVAAGKEANKLAHKSYISPDELNKMNYDQLMNSHTLIHAANPTKGQQRENVKYYRREGQPGNYTYYYTKEEWDNRGSHSGNADQATKEASERWLYEGKKKYGKSGNENWVREMNANVKGEQMDRDLKYVDSLKKDISEGVRDVVHDRKNPVGKLMDYIEDAFDDGELRMDEKGNMSGDEKVIAKIQEMSKEAEDYGKNLGSNLGEEGSKKVWNEFQKQTGDRVSKLTKTYNVKDEATKIFDEKGEDGVADYLAETDEWKNMEKEVRKLISEGKLRLNKDNSGFNNISKEKESELDNLYEQIEDYIDVIGDGTGINKRAIREKLNTELTNLAASHSETKYETKSNGKDNYNSGDKKFANTNKETDEYQSAKLRKIIKDEDRKRENASKNNGSRSLTGKDNNPERDRYAKHSADDSKALITNSNMGDEIMDEYSVFQEKVKRGKEMNRIAHSTFISPSDLNARYEKDLEKEGILVHAGNYKYYNKIDLPNGTTRYFYTKAEWDAYQRGEDGKKQDEFKKQQAQKKVAEDRNDMSGYNDWKKEQNKKTNNSSNVSKDIQNYNDTLNQVKEADKSLNVQVAQNMREEAIKNSKVQSEPNVKPSELAVALKQILDDSKTLKAQEAQNKREEAIKKSQEAGKEADRINKINNDYKNAINENTKLSSEIDKKYDFDDIEDEDDLKECWKNLLGDIREIKDNVDNPDKVRYDISENNESYSAYIDDYLKKEIKLNEEIKTAFRKGQNARNYDESKKYGDEWTKLNKEKEYLVKEHKAKVYNYINNLYKELLK